MLVALCAVVVKRDQVMYYLCPLSSAVALKLCIHEILILILLLRNSAKVYNEIYSN